ncbi:MAG: hypothetical protein JRI45_01345 [Deltaproteobacteria bacterium]|nr:hypothetical protein [Deltaproteobacteria bacterium]MBW2067344.1 hypothetical protein [Deltaproteobacteria bacterium]
MIRKVILMACFLAVLATPLFSQENVVVEKNLFAPDRKPPAIQENSKTVDHGTFNPDDIQLDGIIYFQHEKRALVRLRRNIGEYQKGNYVVLKEGESIGPYKVTKVGKASIIVNWKGQEQEIPLYQSGKIAAPPPPLPKVSVVSDEEVDKLKEFPSPEEFKNLSPEEKEKLVEKMRNIFLMRLKRRKLEKKLGEPERGMKEDANVK